MILEVEKLTKKYPSGNRSLTVLNGVSFQIEQGSTNAIVGPSGSGKSTLLGLAAGLDRPSSGRVVLNGRDLNPLSEEQLAELRNQHVGFVFQNFQLIPTLTALENVMVPLELRGGNHSREKAEELLSRVGLGDRLHHYPSQLSGGEQQRVSLARAFVNRPLILFADEPTGNLDGETSGAVAELLFRLNRDEGTTLVVVTHNMELASKTERVITLRSGSIESDRRHASEKAANGEG
ncbi:MAG TPA: ABC transporter ATP-binding protein [Acidobacteriota bacterium]|nr:ABC transporter ATP-binding protein [Acidobacteriota bacterium]